MPHGIFAPRRTVLTQNGEACGPGPDGGLDGLALVHGVILQLCPQDLQVVLSRQVVPHHQVLGVTCGGSRQIKGLAQAWR